MSYLIGGDTLASSNDSLWNLYMWKYVIHFYYKTTFFISNERTLFEVSLQTVKEKRKRRIITLHLQETHRVIMLAEDKKTA